MCHKQSNRVCLSESDRPGWHPYRRFLSRKAISILGVSFRHRRETVCFWFDILFPAHVGAAWYSEAHGMTQINANTIGENCKR